MLADDCEGRDDNGHYSNGAGRLQRVIRCVDTPTSSDLAVWAQVDKQIRQRRRSVPRRSSPDTARAASAPSGRCRADVDSRTSSPRRRRAASWSSPQRMTADPSGRRGPRPAVARAKITYDGTQHTVAFSGDSCVDDAITLLVTSSTAPTAAT